MNNKTSVAIRFDAGSGSIWKRIGLKKTVQQFITQPSSETYLWRQFTDGTEQLERKLESKQVGRLDGSAILSQVMTSDFECSICHSGLKDTENSDFDLAVVGRWKVSNSRAFLNDYGLNRLKSSNSISIFEIEALLAKQCKQGVTDEVKGLTYDALVNRDALPAQWWQNKLTQWVDCDWLELLEVKDIRYESASIERAKEIRKQQELLELEAAEDAQRKEHELRLRQQQVQFEQAEREIQQANKLSEQERQIKQEQLEQKRQLQALETKLATEQVRLEHEKKKAELEAELAHLRNDADAAEQILDKAKQAEQRTTEMMAAIHNAQREIADSAKLINTSLQSVLAGQSSSACRLGVSAANVSTATMNLLGKDCGPAYLAQVFREKASCSPDSVMMRKVELRTRDIGTKKVDTLAINSSLQFEVMSQRSGYATILNIGTSGKVWLQVPNAYVGIGLAKIEVGQTCQIPGRLLPAEDLSRQDLAYLEVGPRGWEELIVIVSDKPLVTEADMFHSTQDNPFVPLSADRIEQLLDFLAELPENEWSAGVLSFLVE